MKRVDIILTALVLVAVTGFAIYLNSGLESTYDTMEFIRGRYDGGKFIDYDRAIAVDSVDDIGWWKDGENWYVQYGKLSLKFTPKDLKDPKFLEMVKAIGLDIYGNVDAGCLKFYWQEIELKELVPQ